MKKKSLPTALSVALVLLCLVLVTAHFTTGMFARYTTKSRGADTGRIASFQVSATSTQSGPIELTPTSRSGEYELTVANNGEVTVRYDAEVIFDDPTQAPKFGTTTLTGTLAAGEHKTGTLTLDMSQYEDGGADTVPFTVVVTFTQID